MKLRSTLPRFEKLGSRQQEALLTLATLGREWWPGCGYLDEAEDVKRLRRLEELGWLEAWVGNGLRLTDEATRVLRVVRDRQIKEAKRAEEQEKERAALAKSKAKEEAANESALESVSEYLAALNSPELVARILIRVQTGYTWTEVQDWITDGGHLS